MVHDVVDLVVVCGWLWLFPAKSEELPSNISVIFMANGNMMVKSDLLSEDLKVDSSVSIRMRMWMRIINPLQ